MNSVARLRVCLFIVVATSCSQVLIGPLEQRGLTVDMVDVFADASNTPLTLSLESVHLAGKILRVRGMSVRLSARLSLYTAFDKLMVTSLNLSASQHMQVRCFKSTLDV